MVLPVQEEGIKKKKLHHILHPCMNTNKAGSKGQQLPVIRFSLCGFAPSQMFCFWMKCLQFSPLSIYHSALTGCSAQQRRGMHAWRTKWLCMCHPPKDRAQSSEGKGTKAQHNPLLLVLIRSLLLPLSDSSMVLVPFDWSYTRKRFPQALDSHSPD